MSSASLEQLLQGSDRGLDVALGAALIAYEDDPATDVERIVDEVDRLALGLRRRLRKVSPRADRRLEVLNRYFFDELGFSAVTSIPGRHSDQRIAGLILPHVLRRRSGHCVGLSSIYLALGYRAGLPLFGVSAPRHFFVRWDGEGLRQNVELTARGAPHPDSYYVERYSISEDAINRGVHLQSLRRREVLVEILNNRASFHWDRGDVVRASRDLDRVVVASHNFARAYAGRGFIALQRGELKAARDDLDRALAIDPGYSRAHLLLGQVHLRGGWLARAEASFQRAIDLDSGSALAATYLGRCVGARGEHDRALAFHERAVRADPKCEAAWNNLGRVHTSLGQRDEARVAFKEALRSVPGSLTARANLVLLEKHAGSLSLRGRVAFRSVCRAYERALAQAPENDQLRARYVHFLLGAERSLQRALPLALELGRRSPTPYTLATLARVQLALGRRGHALESVQRAIELDGARGGTERAQLVALQREVESSRR